MTRGDDDRPAGATTTTPATEVPAVPTGLQRLLRLAAVDAGFARELLARRAAVADAAGVGLTPGERAVLQSVPAAQLEVMVRTLPPPPVARRDFLRRTAATAVVLLGGAALGTAAPAHAAPAYAAPGAPADPAERVARPRHSEMQTKGGIDPDVERDTCRLVANVKQVEVVAGPARKGVEPALRSLVRRAAQSHCRALRDKPTEVKVELGVDPEGRLSWSRAKGEGEAAERLATALREGLAKLHGGPRVLPAADERSTLRFRAALSRSE
jgi:hypothetical protein